MASQQPFSQQKGKTQAADYPSPTLTDSAKEAAGRAGGMARDAASNMAQKTADAGAYIMHKADDATSAVGDEMKSLAGTLRNQGPHEGMLGNASSSVANSLEACSKELEHGLSGIAEDIGNTIRRHPVPAIFVGIGLGFLLARIFAK